MARGSHAPEGSRARGSAWITMGGAWERVKRVGKLADPSPDPSLFGSGLGAPDLSFGEERSARATPE
jgi:hypothetical protein